MNTCRGFAEAGFSSAGGGVKDAVVASSWDSREDARSGGFPRFNFGGPGSSASVVALDLTRIVGGGPVRSSGSIWSFASMVRAISGSGLMLTA